MLRPGLVIFLFPLKGHRTVRTTEGPQNSVNHRRATEQCEPQKGHRTVRTTEQCKPQKGENSANHRRATPYPIAITEFANLASMAVNITKHVIINHDCSTTQLQYVLGPFPCSTIALQDPCRNMVGDQSIVAKIPLRALVANNKSRGVTKKCMWAGYVLDNLASWTHFHEKEKGLVNCIYKPCPAVLYSVVQSHCSILSHDVLHHYLSSNSSLENDE